MNNPIKLTDTLSGVVVPKETIKCEIKNNVANTESLYLKAFKDEYVYRFIPIEEKGVFELLGEVTADSISKELEGFLKYEFSWCEYEFRSLLQSKGIYFVNPIEKPKVTNLESSFFEMQVDFNQEKEWQEAESKLVEKVVIIKKV